MAHVLTESEKNKLEHIPAEQKPLIDKLIGLLPDDLPENPKTGVFYAYREEQSICANGEPYHGLIKLGKDRNKVVIIIQGGGVSVNEYTAARGNCVGGKSGPDTFYVEDCFGVGDFTGMLLGYSAPLPQNPFKNYTVLFVPYANGDFYAGDGELPYVDLEGNDRLCYHHGHTNLFMLIHKLKELVPHPETVVVSGYSAGGFGTMINSKEIFDTFKDTPNKVTLVDSSLIISNQWHDIAKNVWHAKKEIYDVIQTEDMTYDFLTDLKKNHPDAKILFACATKDALLAECENFMSYGKLEFTKESGPIFKAHLNKLVEKLQRDITDNLSFFFFDTLNAELDPALELCQHCISMDKTAYTTKVDHHTFMKWFFDQVNGKIYSCGMDLLK